MIVGSQSGALASAACDAVNAGNFNVNQAGTGVSGKTLSGFAIGDKLTFFVIGGNDVHDDWFLLTISPSSTLLEVEGPSNGTSISYTVTGNNGDTTLQTNLSVTNSFVSMSASATCTPAPPNNNGGAGNNSNNNTNIDSQKLRELQIDLTKTVAANSGAAITGAIDGAIGDAFSANGGNPVSVGSSGIRLNLTAEPPSRVTSRTKAAFAALNYDGNVTKAPPLVLERAWSAWADLHGTGFDRNSADTRGHQLNFTGGIGYKFTPDLLAGLFVGYEQFNYKVDSLTGRLSGNGGTVGGYAAYRFTPHLRLDGAVGWSDVAYDASAGTAAGSFTGSRIVATGALTGDYRYDVFLLEPSVRVYALWESENAGTDSLGTLQAARNFSEGRVATGGKVIYPWQATSDLLVSPYVGLYGDYRFSTDNALPVGLAFVGIKDGWSERVTAGVTVKSGLDGPTFSLGAELGGLGAGYDLWTANARVNWPF
jgi:hypothetical protein